MNPKVEINRTGLPRRWASLIAMMLWALVGNIFLLFCAVKIYLGKERWFSSLDLWFWSTVLALLLVRYADIFWLGGRTLNHSKATGEDWRQYARLFLECAVFMWLAVHVAAYFFVPLYQH